ncbi:sulfur oxidation c-type cytochrome SoxX [Rhizobacter sp. AJA081-3]|uniref:sulfur oxidation c-type cytochrome SoxX n=1 Tax=Rhizobacter sp. AJA081-3 TaxID=2753607 RepID=UPI001ADF7E16|nr:sulfur oxidation c-type cytochrome SoxX [Rhizobacter sp. AJA081-3]QTN23857.1 sulfur oxidation c-type cytochrome SoxX [Rhizobacter sp. AJA081-3]
MKKTLLIGAGLASAALLAGCANAPSPAELDQQTLAMLKASFRDQGIAKVDRLEQDLGQKACSSDKPPAESVAKQIEAEALASIKWPEGGRYIGDWREGEKLAQNGRGMTWTDASAEAKANGANCYNCHQIDKKEISYGTIGPSLWNYGKTRGVKDVADPATAAIVQYTWGKMWNSKAYAACSNMPRFGHAKLLNEDQLRHVMALLLDPKSPVNQ